MSGSAGSTGQGGTGRGQPGVEQLDLLAGVTGEVLDAVGRGIGCGRHCGTLEVLGGPHDLDGLVADRCGGEGGEVDAEHLVELDGGIAQPCAE